MADNLFKHLNPQQEKAVRHTKGASIILAGAGSGKTRVLTLKVFNLISKEKVDAKRIMMVTFTNKAAGEMEKRVRYKLGFVGTFHSFCAMLLRKDGAREEIGANFVIYDESDSKKLITNLLKKMKPPKKYTPSYVKNRISEAKDQLISPQKYSEMFDEHSSQIIARIYRKYQQELKKNNALDFDDLLYMAVLLLRKNKKVLEKYQDKFHYILVDEFQDTNHAQYILTKLLAQKRKNVTVVGDFSQSIYSWRGAEIANLRKFSKDFENAETFYLEKNYRSTQNILNFAYRVISANETHPVLDLFTDNKGGEEVTTKQVKNEQYEAIFIAETVERIAQEDSLDSIAILYRINAQSRVIEESFLHYGIPYVLIGGTRFYERKEIKDILSYIRLITNPKDDLSRERALKIGKRRYQKFDNLYKKIKKQAENLETLDIVDRVLEKTEYLSLYKEEDLEDFGRLENIKELRSVAMNFPNITDFLQQIALVESEYSESEKKKKDKKGVYMMTLHQAKGLEFPYVFITGVEDGILPHSRSMYDLFQLEEERRLFYVGITRAKKKLYITHTRKRFLFGRRGYSQISRFLEGAIENSF